MTTIGPTIQARGRTNPRANRDQLAFPGITDVATARYSAADVAAGLGLPTPTDEQAAVVESPLEPGVVVAGAGSGKTETMAARVVWLVANGLVRPEEILGLTFTRKAARELAARIRHRLAQLHSRGLLVRPDPAFGAGGDPARDTGRGDPREDGSADATVATYDAYAQRIVAEHALRLGVEPAARLVTPAIAWQYATRVVEAYDGPMDAVDAAFSTVVDAVLALHGELCGHLVSGADLRAFTEEFCAMVRSKPKVARTKGDLHADVAGALARQESRAQLIALVEAFVAEKHRREAVDFGDQAALAARLATTFPEVGERERERYKVVLLDEYQDTSVAQLAMVRGLFAGTQSEGSHPVTAVGDPCQSIYGWRGASAATLQAFGGHFPTSLGEPAPTRTLTTSFRNGANILAAANVLARSLRADGMDVPELVSHPVTGDGAVIAALHPTIDDEANDIAARARAIWTADEPKRRSAGTGASGPAPRTIAVLVRRRAQIERILYALRTAGLPVEVVGVGGLLATPAVSDVVATLRVLSDPTRGDALVRLLSGSRWRTGPRDLDALGRWARRRMAAPASTPEQPADVEPDEIDERSIIDALDALPDEPGWFSPAGERRLRALAAELRTLRRRSAQPLVDLTVDVMRTLGLDIEVAARTGEVAVSRVDLDAFLDVAAEFADSGEQPTLRSFLAYLDAADAEERGLEPGQVEVTEDRIQVLTVHGAKGLEWDVVFVTGMVEGVFPGASAKDKAWLGELGALPFPLRGDAGALPVLDVRSAADQGEVKASFDRFVEDCGERARMEERRLAYVAVTRARQVVVCSGYRWDETKRPREPGEYLQQIAAAARAGAGEIPVWCDEPGEENPIAAQPRSHAWPYDPLDEQRRAELEAGAALVAERIDAQRHGDTGDAGEADDTAGDAAFEAAGAAWREDIDVLLAERARRAGSGSIEVELPERLSVSQLVMLRRDPTLLARAIRRPLPNPPNPMARRGTAFHAWLERRFGVPRLLDVEELPGSADENAADDSDLKALQDAFLESEWAERTPMEVEAPFELVIAGVVVRGRADAVFTGTLSDGESDGASDGASDGQSGLEVVDWKTGPPPSDPAEEAARAVQLAAYRLAWAQLSGLPVERVRAAFHHVRHNRTIRPVDLLDRAGLERLVTSVPTVESADVEGAAT